MIKKHTIFVFFLLTVTNTAYALFPAILPNKADVQATEVSPIDGDWIVSANNKRIRIDRGRAYALDTWQHAVVFTISPDMVVIKDIRSIGDNVYEGQDLPLIGTARMQQLPDGNIDVTVTTGMGPVNYRLIAVNAVSTVQQVAVQPVEPSPEVYAPVDMDAPEPVEPPTYRSSVQTSEQEYSPAQYPDPAFAAQQLPEFVSTEAYKGCQPDEDSAPSQSAPRERLATRVDQVTQRQFVGFTLEQARGSQTDDEKLGLCWMRLDGVWQESRNISLDRSKDAPDIWGTDSPELIVLANGNYTDLQHLYIGSVGRDEEEIWVSDGLSSQGFIRFVSDDGLTLKDTLVYDGPVKTYRAQGRSYLGETLRLDLTASSRPRLRLNTTTYLRPALALSESAMQQQTASDDAFLLQANMENLTASRRGYDVVKQDPFFLLDNKKMSVFAKFDPKRYHIAEQRIIPVGFKFFQEGVQGMVYSRSMTTTAREYQDSVSVSLGASHEGKGDPMGFSANSSVSVDASVSWMNSMEESQSAAQALGFSRAKKYALVVDHPFVTLSKDFIDAIADASRYGNYEQLIERFGTHYPYAVTYGAAAKITQTVSESSFKKLTEWNAGVDAEMAGGTMGQTGSVRASIKAGTVNGSSGSLGSEGATFVAVGGNGSWNENGYSPGTTPYPILLDLRPLHELLNQMNFPDQPEIYTGVRAGLKQAIAQYMQRHTNVVSDRSLLPALEPVKLETWHLYVREVWCTGKGVALAHSATGKLEMEAYMGQRGKGYKATQHKNFEAKCKKKFAKTKHSYKVPSPGLIELTGTREQIAAYVLKLRLQWRYTPSNRNKWRNHEKAFAPLTALKSGLGRGKSKDQVWKVGAKGKPDFIFNVRAKRIK